MDKELKQLLVEVAKTVLKMLDPPLGDTGPVESKRAVGVVARVNDLLSGLADDGEVKRGEAVRIWDGNRYVVGRVQSICHRKEGQPRYVQVRVERGEGRKGKTHKVEAAKAQRVGG